MIHEERAVVIPSPETHPDTSRTISYTKRTNVIRAEIRNLKRLGPLPTDDDDYPGIDRELLDFELLLAAIDPPITMEEARVLASLFPEDGSTIYGLAWSLVHLIGTLSIDEYKKIIPDIGSEEWRRDFEQWARNAESEHQRTDPLNREQRFGGPTRRGEA